MDYKKFKLIEQYLKLGELIRKNQLKINALNNIEAGFLSLGDLSLIQEELSGFGLFGNDFMGANELKDALLDEIEQLHNERENLKDIANQYRINLDKVMFDKSIHEGMVHTKMS